MKTRWSAMYILATVLIAFTISGMPQDLEGDFDMDDIVSVAVSGGSKPSILHGPVEARVTVANLLPHTVQILLPYPNPNNLSFVSNANDFAKPKEVERLRIERTIPIQINPGKSHTTVYFLNRYLTFLKAGKGSVRYRLAMLVTQKPDTEHTTHEDRVFEGEFAIELSDEPKEALHAELERYATHLNSSDRQEKMQAAEALAFLDTPMCLDYVERMLSIDNLEVIGIRALGRHPSPKTYDLAVGMLSHRDSMVVAAALAEIDRFGIEVSRQEIQNLLASDNPNIRWLALDWLARRPDPSDLQYLAALLEDENTNVRTLANNYAASLRTE
jgi:hypothetical protein